MAARFLDKVATVATGNTKNLPDAAGIAYDTDDGFIKYNDAGTLRTVVNTDEAQTLTNKTFTSAVVNAAVETVTTTNVIAASESGTTYFLSLAGGFTSTLPAPAAGLNFKFIVKTAPTTAYIIATNGGADIMIGGINELEVDTADDGPYDDNADTLNFVANIAAVGDWVEFVSDGTSWYFTGQTNLDGGITTATT